MKIALNLAKILIFILALYVLTQNSNQTVDVKLLGNSYPAVSLLVVVLISLTAGAVLGAVFMAFAVIQGRSNLRALRARNQQLMSELENLRNISVEDIPDENLPEPPAAATRKLKEGRGA